MNHNTFPPELTALPQWTCYKLVPRTEGQKLTKPPYQVTGHRASVTDPRTWAPFATVLAAVHRFDGLGFVFTAKDPYVGIDVDHCRDAQTGALTDTAQWVVTHVPTYTEISPSGTGLHLIVRGAWPFEIHRGGQEGEGIEVYDTRRYFTMTGHRLAGTPDTIATISPEMLQELHDRFFPTTTTHISPEPPREPSPPSPVDLLKRMFASKVGNKIQRLWDGNTEGYPSPSEADEALCSYLAWWTQKDASAMDRLFRLSGLYRKKWDDDTYRARTIAKALNQAGQYDPAWNKKPSHNRSVTGNPGELQGKKTQGGKRHTPALGTILPDDAPETSTDPALTPYIPLPETIQPNPDLAATACPWLDAYIAYSQQWSPRGVPLLHETGGVWLLSVIAGGRLHCDLGPSHITTLLLAVCAPSSVYAKSTTVNLAIRLLDQAGLRGLLHADESTPQALLKSMAKPPIPDEFFLLPETERAIITTRAAFAGQRSWFYEEWGQQLKQMQRSDSPMALLHGLLRRLDDGRLSHASDTIARGREEVNDPYLSLLSNCTPADLAAYCGPGHAYWHDGLWARFAFIGAGETPPSRARLPRRHRFQIPASLVKEVRGWHTYLGIPDVTIERNDDNGKQRGTTPTGHHTKGQALRAIVTRREPHHPPISNAIFDAYDAYDDAMAMIGQQLPNDWHSCYARYHTRAARLAVLLSSMDYYTRVGDLKDAKIERPIELTHWHRALTIVERWRESHHRLMAHIHTADFAPPTAQARLEHRILKLVQREPHTIRGIRRYVRNSYEEISRAITTLERADVLEKIEHGKTATYRLRI